MLTRYDEFLCHQIASTFDHVETSAREWTERIIIHTHDTSGRFHLSCGMGIYRNRNVTDAFACLTLDGRTQYVVRASRELRSRPDETVVGPFSYETTEPLKKVRYALGENPQGIAYDLVFEGRMPCHEEDQQFFRVRGRVIEHVERYDQVGRAVGWIRAAGQMFRFDRENALYVERDHSWGIRREGVGEAGVQPGDIPEGYLYSWAVMQFPSWGAAYHIRELSDETRLFSSGGIFYPFESKRKELRVKGIAHDFHFRPDLRKATSGRVALIGEDGVEREIWIKPLAFACINTGGYFLYKDFVHGKWMGPEWQDGFTLNLADPAVLRAVSFLDNTSCEFRCGDEIGYGVLELVVTGKYPRYGYQGY